MLKKIAGAFDGAQTHDWLIKGQMYHALRLLVTKSFKNIVFIFIVLPFLLSYLWKSNPYFIYFLQTIYIKLCSCSCSHCWDVELPGRYNANNSWSWCCDRLRTLYSRLLLSGRVYRNDRLLSRRLLLSNKLHQSLWQRSAIHRFLW